MQIQRDPITTSIESGRTMQGPAGTTTPTLPQEVSDQSPNQHDKDVLKSVDSLQKQLERMQETRVQMEFDKEIDRVIVKYVNQNDGEVVSQIPSEKFVAFEKEFVKTVGLLFDMKF